MALYNSLDSGNGRLWLAHQSAAGSMRAAADASQFSPKVITSELKPAKDYGSASYVDGFSIENNQQFTSAIGGEVGMFRALVQTDVIGRLAAIFFGEDTVTGSSPDYVHTITSSGPGGKFVTLHQSVGAVGLNDQQIYWDAIISKMAFECSRETEAAEVECDIKARVAAQQYSTDPTAAITSDDAVTWPNVTGSVDIGGTTYESIQGDSWECDLDPDLERGDGTEIVSFARKRGKLTRALSTFFNSETLPLYYESIYGTATPSAGDVPVIDVVSSSVETTYTVTPDRYVKFTTPNVVFDPGEFSALSPDAEGGSIELELSGSCRPDGSDAALTIEVGSAVSTSFIA